MTWIRRATSDPHTCAPPMRESVHRLPSMSAVPQGDATVKFRLTRPDGEIGDLWRCPCGALWRIGHACDACDWVGEWPAHDGGHAIGVTWRPATLWQRIRYRKRGRA